MQLLRSVLPVSLLAGLLLLPNPCAPQERIVIGSQPSCADCVIEIEHVATLGTVEGGEVLGDPRALVRDSRGRSFVTFFIDLTQIAVFGPDGQFLHYLGHYGEGPGEFSTISHLAMGQGDTLLVMDSGNSRISAFSPDGTFAWSILSRGTGEEIIWMGNRTFVFAGNVPTPDLIGYPLHVTSPDGTISASFGAVGGGVYRPDMPYLNMRSLVRLDVRTFWAGHKTQYVMELWDVEGNRMAEVAREADWFEPYFEKNLLSSGKPPSPWFETLNLSQDGRHLIAITSVPVSDWKDHMGTLIQTPTGTRREGFWSGNIRESVIEILDIESSSVLTRRKVPQLFVGFSDPEHLYCPTRDADGNPFIEIWRVRLRKP